MDLLFEILFEIFFDGSVEIAKSKKVNKWIKYPIIVFLGLFILSIFALLGYIGILLLISDKTYSTYAGIILLIFEGFLIITGIWKLKKEIKRLKENKD